MGKSDRGFVSMDEDKRKRIARKGGKASSEADYEGGPASNLSDEDRIRGQNNSYDDGFNADEEEYMDED